MVLMMQVFPKPSEVALPVPNSTPLQMDDAVKATQPVGPPRSQKRVAHHILSKSYRRSTRNRDTIDRYKSDMFTMKSQLLLQLVDKVFS